MADVFEKTTVLEGYAASGDYECFCFDKQVDGPEKHMSACDHCRAARTWQDQDAGDDFPAGACVRVYPNDLMPDGAARRVGRWTVTVRFEPDEESR